MWNRPGEVPPDWSADLVTYTVREEFQPELDAANSTIVGHDDEALLHPGVPYTAQISLSDGNGWQDIQQVQFALGGDFDDEDTSIFITLAPGEDGMPVAQMSTGGEFLAVSNLYSDVQLDAENPNLVVISALFQLTGVSQNPLTPTARLRSPQGQGHGQAVWLGAGRALL